MYKTYTTGFLSYTLNILKILSSKVLTDDQSRQIDHLWNELYPLRLKDRFGLLLEGIQEFKHHILLNNSEEVIGWAVSFYRNEETWFSLLISATYQNMGYGKMLLDSLKQNSNNLCGWVIDHNSDLKHDGTTYHTPIKFYLNNGFTVMDERLETDIISAVKIKFEE